MNASLREEDQWILPISFKAVNLTSPIGKLGSSMALKAKGVWRNPLKRCSLYNMMSNNKECGKMTDVVEMSFEFNEGNGYLSFSGDGYCVTPNAGCPQVIDSFPPNLEWQRTENHMRQVVFSEPGARLGFSVIIVQKRVG